MIACVRVRLPARACVEHDASSAHAPGAYPPRHPSSLPSQSLRYLESHINGVCEVFNLGSGKPTSVLMLVKAMEQACGKPIPREFGPRRAGDLPSFYAATDKAAELLGWRTELSVADMCADTWRWQSKNPQGFATPRE